MHTRGHLWACVPPLLRTIDHSKCPLQKIITWRSDWRLFAKVHLKVQTPHSLPSAMRHCAGCLPSYSTRRLSLQNAAHALLESSPTLRIPHASSPNNSAQTPPQGYHHPSHSPQASTQRRQPPAAPFPPSCPNPPRRYQ